MQPRVDVLPLEPMLSVDPHAPPAIVVPDNEVNVQPAVHQKPVPVVQRPKPRLRSYGAVDYERPPMSTEAELLEKQLKHRRELKRALFRHWRALDHARIIGLHLLLLLFYLCYMSIYGFSFDQVYDHSSFLNQSGFVLSGGQIAVFSSFTCYLLVVLVCLSLIHSDLHRLVHQLLSLSTALVFPAAVWLNFILDDNFPQFDNDCVWVCVFPALLCGLFLQLTLWPDRGILFTAIAALWALGHVLLAAWVASFHQNTRRIIMQLAAQLLILTGTVIVGMYNNISVTKNRTESCHSLGQAVDRRTILQYERERQEQLLLSIIPAHLAAQVRKTISEGASETKGGKRKKPNKLFHDLHVQLHENVSILFADIVNFTPLTASMGPKDLVKTLNELYSKFDQLAQDLQCMRIKILGDCYYCVSGMPINRPNHADNIVQMGLAMIEIIKTLRESSGVDVDMRIGVHTGSVLCGILGLRKWQFDIWSDDVTLANHMESGGCPGRVHITKTTRYMLSGEYTIVDAQTDDEYVLRNGEKTFFIVPQPGQLTHVKSLRTIETIPEVDERNRSSKSRSVPNGYADMNNCEPPRSSSGDSQGRLSTHSLSPSGQLAPNFAGQRGGHKMSKAVESWGATSAPFANLSRRRSSDRIREASMTLIENNLSNFSLGFMTIFNNSHPLTWYLTFRQLTLGIGFLPYAKRHFMAEALVLTAIGLGMGAFDTLLPFESFKVTLTLILICVFVSLCNGALAMVYKFVGIKNALVLSVISLVIFFLCIFLSAGPQWLRAFDECVESALSLPACLLHLLAVTVLNSVPFNLRAPVVLCFALINLITLVSTGICSQAIENNTFYQHQSGFEHTDYMMTSFWKLSSILHIAFATIVALWIGWLSEYEHKAQWACLSSFRDEQEDVQTMQDVNNLLIENILPTHVGQYFLGPEKPMDELYHESHDQVCVMFASIPNFKDFWGEWDVSRKLECLRLQNEIVCEFDKLLSKPKFSSVEKIKTVGSTYMAAAGLKPTPKRTEDRTRYCIIMVDFVFGMQSLLDQINKDSFQSFKLRVGISFGPLVAGVIGAQKPMYDIWGNTVNLASRMDSHGGMGKIHMTSEAGEALKLNGYPVESRGKIKVKGVHQPIETFYLDLESK